MKKKEKENKDLLKELEKARKQSTGKTYVISSQLLMTNII